MPSVVKSRERLSELAEPAAESIMRGGFDRDRAAQVLVDAITLGDKTAADRHKVSEKTVQRYRARLVTDPVLSELVQQRGREAEHGWHFARARFLRRTLEKLDEMVQAAQPEQFEHVIEALKAAGELDLATEVLGVGRVHRQQGAASAEDAGGGEVEGSSPAAADEAADEGAGT